MRDVKGVREGGNEMGGVEEERCNKGGRSFCLPTFEEPAVRGHGCRLVIIILVTMFMVLSS